MSNSETASVLREMFCENTGHDMCDSGGEPKYDADGNYLGSQYGYGRNYERNQGRNFDAEKPTFLKFDVRDGTVEIEFSLNTYHWLNERCELADLNGVFHGQFLKDMDEDDSKSWFDLVDEFPGWLAEQEDEEGNPVYGHAGGIYGEEKPFAINTYNHESLLDQTIQYMYFTLGDSRFDRGEYIILQVHGGADVRGGYTKPRVFSVGNHSEMDIFDDRGGTIYCTGKDHHPTALALREKQERQLPLPLKGAQPSKIDFEGSHDHCWDTDDGCHWYYQGSCGRGAETQLEKYEARDLDDEDGEDVWEEGVLCVKDGVGYCPYCGAVLAGASL